MTRRLIVLSTFALILVALAAPQAHACRDYDGHRNSVVPPGPPCGEAAGIPNRTADNSIDRQAQAAGYGANTVDAAIDAVGLPAVFHTIAARESGDDPYAVNPVSGACGPFQFLPSTAASMGYSCDQLTDPYTAATAALELYNRDGLSPWSATVY